MAGEASEAAGGPGPGGVRLPVFRGVTQQALDAKGRLDISPKGDPGGFVEVESATSLLIPERPGNRLTFGFNNILENGKIGLLLVVPNQRETLRVKGIATLMCEVYEGGTLVPGRFGRGSSSTLRPSSFSR